VITPKERQMLEAHLLGMDRAQYLCMSHTIAPDMQQTLNQFIARRNEGEPIAKIIGRKEFWRDEFFTSTHTLDPRPESELIIESALHLRPNRQAALTILDIGTGTGCLLLSLLQEYPNASGVGIDISEQAISTANRNATALKLQNRCLFHNLSWTDAPKSLYDIIITNPPYIPTGDIDNLDIDVKNYDPMQALDGGIDGLDAYRQILAISGDLLKDDGIFICEIGINQHIDVAKLAIDAGFNQLLTQTDLAGIIRVLVFNKSHF
jgi:release factor glutamine methyltransferase